MDEAPEELITIVPVNPSSCTIVPARRWPHTQVSKDLRPSSKKRLLSLEPIPRINLSLKELTQALPFVHCQCFWAECLTVRPNKLSPITITGSFPSCLPTWVPRISLGHVTENSKHDTTQDLLPSWLTKRVSSRNQEWFLQSFVAEVVRFIPSGFVHILSICQVDS